MRVQLFLSCVVLVALAHTAFSIDIEAHLQKGNLARRLAAAGIGAGDSSCAKVVADIIEVETSWRKKGPATNKREDTCGAVAFYLLHILGGPAINDVPSVGVMSQKFSTNKPPASFTGFCDPAGNTEHMCTCPHVANTATDCAHHFKVDTPNSWYVFHIATTPGVGHDSHWGVFYINSKANKAYIFQAFANLHPLEITETTPAKIKNAFNLMVSKHAPHAPATPADMKDLALFDAHNQAYVDAVQYIRIAGPFSKAVCQSLALPKNQATSRNRYCDVFSRGTYHTYAHGKCV